ncbi:Synthase, mitochondrial [Oopsacas minuta]|uniref:Synthase, mitochondrial n=1 Tax=Oopsacas minuta TaxID=111878 RepID=A0AAV7JKJ0_9METZ|nr:Synthase, mitochondrial [Oopsacas minuta]
MQTLIKRLSVGAMFLRPSISYRQLSDTTDLKARLAELIPIRKLELAKFKEVHDKTVIGNITVGMLYKGMRGMKGLVTETSLLDPEELTSGNSKLKGNQMFCIFTLIKLFTKKHPKHPPLYVIYQDIADVDNLYTLLLLGRVLNVSPDSPMRLVLMPRLVDLSVAPFDSERETFNLSMLIPGPLSSDSCYESELIFKDSATRIWLYLHKALGHEKRSLPLCYTMDCVRIFHGDYPIGAFAQASPSLAAIDHAVHAHDYVFFRQDLFGGIYGDVITPDDYKNWLKSVRNSKKRSELIRSEIENGFELFEFRSDSCISAAIRSLDELHSDIKLKSPGRNLRLVLLAQATSLVKLLEDRNLVTRVECIHAQYFTWSHSDNVLGEQFNIVLDRIAAENCVRIVKKYRIPFYCITTQYPSNGNAPMEFISKLEMRNKFDSNCFFALRKLWNSLKGGKAQTIFDIWVVALICNSHLFDILPVNVSFSRNQFQLQIDSTKKSKIFTATDSSVQNTRLLVDWMESHIF